MSDFAVEFVGVSKTFGAVQAIRGLDLRIERGQVVALLGANGAGKSTAVSLLMGLLRPDAGTIRVLGASPRQIVTAGRVGVMLQDGGLMPGITVRGLLELACGMYSTPRPVADLLETATLTHLSRRRVDRLSGGQAQRLRFALAIAGNPDLLILDEPTSAMDVESRRAFWETIRASAQTGVTMLFATHYLEEADSNADRIIVMSRGEIVEDDTPAAIKARIGIRTIRFSIGADGIDTLHRLPGVSNVRIHATTAELSTTDVESTARALFATRHRVEGLEIEGVDLEEAFLTLIR
jgi:ABC-2 type transport system ATP-binding protein